MFIFGEESQLGHTGVDLSPSGWRINITGYLSVSLVCACECARACTLTRALTHICSLCLCVCVGLAVARRSAVCDNEMLRVARRHREAETGGFTFVHVSLSASSHHSTYTQTHTHAKMGKIIPKQQQQQQHCDKFSSEGHTGIITRKHPCRLFGELSCATWMTNSISCNTL